MYYYAQLNEKDVCWYVFESEVQQTSDIFIEIPSLDESYINKYYNRTTQQWETATFKHLSVCSTDAINVGETDECLTDALNGKFAKTAVNNPITAIADDTVTKWIELGTGIYYFNRANVLTDQPSQYGFLINFVSGANVFQLWKTQPNAGFCTRGGNANGWSGTWKALVTSADLANYMPKTGGAFTGEIDFSGGLVRVGGQQTIYATNERITFGTTNRETYLTGSTIYSRSAVQVASDIRLKTDIKNVNYQRAVDFINGLQIKEYRYKDQEDKHIGVMAQQLQLLDPEFSEYFVKQGEDGMLSVSQSELVFPLVMTVQALIGEVEQLRLMIQAQQAK